MTRCELLQRISSKELTEWMAYYNIEPFGQETQYFGPAITSTILANVNRNKGDKAHTVDEFMPQFDKVDQTPVEMINFAAMVTAGMSGNDLRTEGE